MELLTELETEVIEIPQAEEKVFTTRKPGQSEFDFLLERHLHKELSVEEMCNQTEKLFKQMTSEEKDLCITKTWCAALDMLIHGYINNAVSSQYFEEKSNKILNELPVTEHSEYLIKIVHIKEAVMGKKLEKIFKPKTQGEK